MSEDTSLNALNPLFAEWGIENPMRVSFDALRAHVEALENVELSANARPGVSWSLRVKAAGSERPFYAMVDVVDDDPSERWLSVCFYDDVTDDTEERGDWIPGGLSGQDARCFNIEEPDDEFVAYVANQLTIGRDKSV
ncbi:MAG: hypothetical protein R3Y11_08060 [Pseudomonadota bacterium]